MSSVLKPGQVAFIYPQADDFQSAVVPQTDDQKKLRTFVERRHPEYDENSKHWDFLEETYEGGREWFKANIFRYIKEGDSEYNSRVERAYRFNHTREVVDLINKYLFKQNILRNEGDAPASVKEFWDSATRSGLNVKDFIRQVSKKTSIFGRVGIIVDRTPAIEGPSIADEKRAGAQTYAYIVGPEQLLDYSYDTSGALNWALIEECVRDDQDPISSSGAEDVRWRLWTKTEWFLFKEVKEGRRKVIVLESNGVHGLGVVPLILADNIITDELYDSPSMIDDIAYLDRAVANYLSNLDAIIQDQTFSQLAMPAQGVLPGEDMYAKLVEMGTKRVFLYDGESGSQPFYLSPDVKQAELILSIINKIINEIYHTVGLAGERTKQDNAVGIDNSSGVAKAFDFERVNALLTTKADSLERVENQLTLLVALWNGEYELIKDNLVSYPDSFDTRTLFDEFDMSARLLLVEGPPTVRRQQMLSLVDKLFPQLSKDLRKQIEDEIENEWPPAVPEVTSNLQGSFAQSELNNTGGQNAQ
ncbi:hypothetical protein UFOVP26_77 [uncultured Caudovirales phage]|uniref:Portal protein n=1 Tax=uncultured Caudovirales phage TaxID=2100421 RepID=A0A6J5KLR4_9CAUD|nr:hypothetical protein UFOVP26_77 [uncultured Caudovirales phage]CAB4123622.1 hypothetical protein UFOVP44_20 [uncultured Caudovirales phage]CAB5218898.1 hypothetical protein UFOVP220_11 [uncultured Caudovirales phage]